MVKQFDFRGQPEPLEDVRGYAGLDVVNLANNHTGDYGKQAMRDTVRHVRRRGPGRRRRRVRSRGRAQAAGRRAARPDVVFVGFSDIGPYDVRRRARARPALARVSSENITADVRAARKLGDVVVATLPLGRRARSRRPVAAPADFARVALAAGADAVIGAHPHVLQPIAPGPRRTSVVAYSLGNFVWSAGSGPDRSHGAAQAQPFHPRRRGREVHRGHHCRHAASGTVRFMADEQILELDGREVRITSPDKVLFAERGETKLDLVRYYEAVGGPLLNTMGGRPVLMQRFPQGASGKGFFQKRDPGQCAGVA